MGRTIDLDAALDALTDYCENKCVNREDAWCSGCHYGISEYVLNALPSAQPEQKVGKWIVMDDDRISGRCSVCGWEAHMYEDDVVGMDYCPNCGAKMERGDAT